MTTHPRKLIAGNWKMNGLFGDGLALAEAIAERDRANEGANCRVLLCPPATLLKAVAEVVHGSRVLVGAQNCHDEGAGPFTGEISGRMVADAGGSHVILGHSERRHGMGETDEQVCRKATAALEAGLAAIVCVGEIAAERDAGDAPDVVARQLERSLPPSADATSLIVAYEPVWAIGSGRTPEVPDIADMHGHIRGVLQNRLNDADGVVILYGGSANPDNAAAILAAENVDGLLVGGASLDADTFWAIVETCR